MFATLFLGAVLGVFLTIGVVRGDAETGLLQPLVVRPVGRATMLVARWAGAAVAAAIYTLLVYAIALALTVGLGDWTPDHVVVPGLLLASSSVVVAAISVLASVFMASTAQGIAVFMVFGAGLVAGLLGQIAEGIESSTLADVARVISYALPFEALYQQALYLLTADQSGITGTIVQLGPFGGGQHAGIGLGFWTVAYCAGVIAVAVAGFKRRDL
jgi:ABC-type transport system involved in multi-copper enzyme maturation permease subunit